LAFDEPEKSLNWFWIVVGIYKLGENMNLVDKVPKIEVNKAGSVVGEKANPKKDAGASGNTMGSMGSQTDQQGSGSNSGTAGTNDDPTKFGPKLSAPGDLIRQSIYGIRNISDTSKISSENKPAAKNALPEAGKTETLIATETLTKLSTDQVAVRQNVVPEPTPTQTPDFQPKTPSVGANTVDARGTVGFDLDKVEANAHIPQAPANTNSPNSEGESAQPSSQQSLAGDSVAVTNMAPVGNTPGSSPSSQQASSAASSGTNNANTVSNPVPAPPPPKSPSRKSTLSQGKNTRARTRSPSPSPIKKAPQQGSQNTRNSAPSPTPTPSPKPQNNKGFVPVSAVLRTRPQGSPEGYQTTRNEGGPLKLPKWADPTAPSSSEEAAAKDTAPKLTRMSNGK
jgi:hypothetical protein